MYNILKVVTYATIILRNISKGDITMGLIHAALGAASGVLADQWKEYFYCEALPDDVLMAKGVRKTSPRGTNFKNSENIITDGSIITVADGQCMIIVEQGKVVDLCAEPGEYVYDCKTEPSIFSGDLSAGIKTVFQQIGKRFTFGGIPANDQRVYYFNTRELMGNKYGTPAPVPFRVVDARIGLDIDSAVRCFGEYSYRITNPILFYTNVVGNVSGEYTRDRIDSQMKTELLTALQPAFARISDMGIRYSALPGHTKEMAAALNEELSAEWRDRRGIEIISFGISSMKLSDEDEQRIKDLQTAATLSNPGIAGGYWTQGTVGAMKDAANNQNAGANIAFMGVNAMNNMGGQNAANLYSQGGAAVPPVQTNPQPAAAAKPANSWVCPKCGATQTGLFCSECGEKRPEADGWKCPKCGKINKGKFCSDCGTAKPAGLPKYKCDKCGWEPEDPFNPPKFCPECGDAFDENDIVK